MTCFIIVYWKRFCLIYNVRNKDRLDWRNGKLKGILKCGGNKVAARQKAVAKDWNVSPQQHLLLPIRHLIPFTFFSFLILKYLSHWHNWFLESSSRQLSNLKVILRHLGSSGSLHFLPNLRQMHVNNPTCLSTNKWGEQCCAETLIFLFILVDHHCLAICLFCHFWHFANLQFTNFARLL